MHVRPLACRCSVETPSRAARLSEPFVGLRVPAGWGPAAQHCLTCCIGRITCLAVSRPHTSCCC